MPTSPKDAAKSRAALDFFRYAMEKGQAQAKTLDYVPLPDALVKQVEVYIAQKIK
jgi:phosphate transport system substrate-binding protein